VRQPQRASNSEQRTPDLLSYVRCSLFTVRCRAAFTLLELLITIAILSLLISILLPSLAAARDAARTTLCLSNQRQLLLAWSIYAGDHKSAAMPLELDAPDALVYWFGSVSFSGAAVDHDRAFLAPYLASDLRERSIYECPSQPWGTYRAQPIAAGPAARPTSTYGYNGYYLCPAGTPGWRAQIGAQRWKTLADLDRPGELLVFADTLLPAATPINTALLDPPFLFGAGDWTANPSPTTCFRHARRNSTSAGAAASARADGSAHVTRSQPSWLAAPRQAVGSIGTANDPLYVPDWRTWR
jgi:prepilin-type N-terminal cleavage/methylation domain-containing protein